MRHLISQFILEKYASGEYEGRLPAASIFIDVSGFSRLTESLSQRGDRGGELLAEVMQALFAPLVEAVYSHGGFIIGYAGDAFTAMFPGQSKDPLPAKRALAASIVMQNYMRAHPLIKTEFGAFPISIKVGLGVGEAEWLVIKDPATGRATYCIRGSSVDAAVAAESLAREAEIILDPFAYEALAGLTRSIPTGGAYRLTEVIGELPGAMQFDNPQLDENLLADFYPENLIQQELMGEFRPVVNVFIDIPMRPTDASFIAPFMENVFALQRRYGGFFLRPDMGDKGFNILMVWGAPAAHENDVDRALNFVLDLRERTGIEFRAGLTYQMAYAGFIGAELREDYTAYGWGVNLASRMMEAASPGELWLDEEVLKKAGQRFRVEELGAIEYKGFTSTINTFSLQGRKRMTELAFRGRLIGRDAEIDRIERFLEPIKRGEFAGVMLVRGEAGIGKSRLIYSLQEAMMDPERVEWVFCQTNEILMEPFEPFRDWLMKRFEITDDLDGITRARNFEMGLQSVMEAANEPDIAGELLRTASFLAALVNIETTGTLYEQLDAKGRYENILIGLSTLLQALAVNKPMIIVIEDLQWLDEESKAFLSYFIHRMQINTERNYGVAILITGRPEADWPRLEIEEQLEYLDLGRLKSAGLAPLVNSLLEAEAGPALIDLLERRSDGNPFFAEQILRYLAENGLLVEQPEGFLVPVPSARDSIPSDVRAVLIARLDRLPPDVRDAIQAASVLGRQFELRLLVHMLGDDVDLPRKVSEAEEADVWYAVDEIEYFFRHALVREAAYGMQLRARQRSLHARALHSIEVLYQDDLSAHFGELAYHADHAENNDKAYDYLIRAASAAADVYQNAQAIEYLTRALSMTPAHNPAFEFDILERRVELYSRTGNHIEQNKDLGRMEELAIQLSEDARLARVWSLKSLYFHGLADFQTAIRFAEQAIARSRGTHEMNAALIAYNTWSISLLRLSNIKASMQVAKEGLEMARLHQNKYYEGLALNSMGMIAYEAENPDEAEEHLESARVVVDEIHDNALKTRILTNLGNVAGFLRKDYATARRYYEEVFPILFERGERSAQAVVLLNWGWVVGAMGDFAASRSYHTQALEISREVGNLHIEAYTLINLSALNSIEGNSGSALIMAQQALELTRRTGDRAGETWALLNLGHAFLEAGNLAEAGNSYSKCAALRREMDQPGFDVEPLAGLVQVALRKEDLQEAMRLTGKILEYLEGGGTLVHAEEPLRIFHICYQALVEAGDTRARSLLADAGRLLDFQLSKLPDENSRQQFLNGAVWRRAIQRARTELGSLD